MKVICFAISCATSPTDCWVNEDAEDNCWVILYTLFQTDPSFVVVRVVPWNFLWNFALKSTAEAPFKRVHVALILAWCNGNNSSPCSVLISLVKQQVFSYLYFFHRSPLNCTLIVPLYCLSIPTLHQPPAPPSSHQLLIPSLICPPYVHPLNPPPFP